MSAQGFHLGRWLEQEHGHRGSEFRRRMEAYNQLVLDASLRMTLISKGDRPKFASRHLTEVLSASVIDLPADGAEVWDVGSGAGIPGIPLAAARPEVRVVLVEPRHRRAAFLERAILALGIRNASVQATSIEGLREGRARILYSRALAWTAPMLEAAERCGNPDAVIARFGEPTAEPQVQNLPLYGGAPRVLQVWPRTKWASLLANGTTNE